MLLAGLASIYLSSGNAAALPSSSTHVKRLDASASDENPQGRRDFAPDVWGKMGLEGDDLIAANDHDLHVVQQAAVQLGRFNDLYPDQQISGSGLENAGEGKGISYNGENAALALNDALRAQSAKSDKGKERELWKEVAAGDVRTYPKRVVGQTQLHEQRPGEKHSTFRFTPQKPPFHTSQIGALSSKQPATMSIGIFDPEYPFTPSGRRKLRAADAQKMARRWTQGGQVDYSEMRAEKAPLDSVFTVSDDIAYGNIFRKGWTRWMLDDDARLSVPDEKRRSRRESAALWAKKMVGKKWYRWKEGEGYVWSRYKDFTAYKQGPGVALGQLLPPRQHFYNVTPPTIPNDAKRDLVWMIVSWITFFSLIAVALEVRSHLRSLRKGKRRSVATIPAIYLPHGEQGTSPIRASSVESASFGLRTRQRSQARNLRDMCKAALFPEGTATRSDGEERTSRPYSGAKGRPTDARRSPFLPKGRDEGQTSNPSRSKSPPTYSLNQLRWNMSVVNGGGSGGGINAGGVGGRSKGSSNGGVLPMANEGPDRAHALQLMMNKKEEAMVEGVLGTSSNMARSHSSEVSPTSARLRREHHGLTVFADAPQGAPASMRIVNRNDEEPAGAQLEIKGHPVAHRHFYGIADQAISPNGFLPIRKFRSSTSPSA